MPDHGVFHLFHDKQVARVSRLYVQGALIKPDMIEISR